MLAGTATVLYLLVFWKTDPSLVLNPLIFWGAMLLCVLGMVLASRKQRQLNGGSLTKQEALKTSFMVVVIAMLFFFAFIYVLFNFIDPGLIDLQKQVLEAAGYKVKSPDELKMTIGKSLQGYAMHLIIGFILSYIVASFVKK